LAHSSLCRKMKAMVISNEIRSYLGEPV
jgi:hypothetical protein